MNVDFVCNFITTRGHEAIEPTVTLVKHWFHILNRVEFQGKLPTPKFEVYSDQDDIFGWMVPDDDIGVIRINSLYNNDRSTLIGTILHEMLHHEQWVNGIQPDHTPEFNVMCSIMTLKYGTDV